MKLLLLVYKADTANTKPQHFQKASPLTTTNDPTRVVEEVLKRIAEVNCSYRPTPKELISAKMGGQELSVSIQAKK